MSLAATDVTSKWGQYEYFNIEIEDSSSSQQPPANTGWALPAQLDI